MAQDACVTSLSTVIFSTTVIIPDRRLTNYKVINIIIQVLSKILKGDQMN